jgi:hypothetical protein
VDPWVPWGRVGLAVHRDQGRQEVRVVPEVLGLRGVQGLQAGEARTGQAFRVRQGVRRVRALQEVREVPWVRVGLGPHPVQVGQRFQALLGLQVVREVLAGREVPEGRACTEAE